MPPRNLRVRALTAKGKTSSGRWTVRYRNWAGKFRNAVVLDGGTNISAPTGLNFTVTASVGAFAAGTYFWKVTATTAGGETTGSNEVTTTVVLNDRVNLTWTAVPEVTGYKVYRGTSTNGQDRLLATVARDVTSFQDTGAAGTGGTVPGSNTSGSGLKLLLPESGTVVNNVPVGTGANSYQAR